MPFEDWVTANSLRWSVVKTKLEVQNNKNKVSISLDGQSLWLKCAEQFGL